MESSGKCSLAEASECSNVSTRVPTPKFVSFHNRPTPLNEIEVVLAHVKCLKSDKAVTGEYSRTDSKKLTSGGAN